MKKKEYKSSGRTIILDNTKKNLILGLDVSSSVIGWGALSIENNKIILVAYGHIIPLDSKHEEIERLADVYNKIQKLCELFKPKKIVIENIVLFMKGLSTAKTITILATFNRSCALSAFHYNKNVEFIPVVTIRKYIKEECGIEEINKEDMPDIILKYLSPQFMKIINKNNKIDRKTGDEADGISVAWAYLIKELKKHA